MTKTMVKRSRRPQPAVPPVPAGGGISEVWLVAATLAVIAAALVFVEVRVHASGPLNCLYQVVTLCLVLAAAAGRLLLGYRAGEQWSLPSLLVKWTLPLVFLAAFLPYLLTLRVGFLSDDLSIAAAMAKVAALSGLTHDVPLRDFYRPLFAFGWWLQRALWGDRPFAYHLVEALLHGACAVLVYVVGRRLTGSRPAALLGGLFFALQPVHVEPITWVCSEADPECALLSLASLLALDLYLGSRRPRMLFVAAAAFLGALLAKEAALTLPLVAMLWIWLRPHGAKAPPARPTRDPKAGARGASPAAALASRPSTLALRVGAAYALAFAVYAALRLAVLGRVGGYRLDLSFWGAIFPSAPMRQLMTFLLPVNQALIRTTVGTWLELLLVLAMAVFAVWCLLNLTCVPGRRLLFYTGFFVLLVAPIWMYPPPVDLAASRWLYLPTISLCWLVGEVLASQRPRGLLRAGAVLAGALALTLWYITPWIGATRMARQVVAQGVRLVRQTPAEHGEPTFFVQDLPEGWLGAQVLGNGFAEALSGALGRPVHLHTVGLGHVPPEMMAVTQLQPGEYLYRWDWRARVFHLVREGRA